jgi:hypothetical protein
MKIFNEMTVIGDDMQYLSWIWTSSRPSPRCPCPGTPPAPSSSGSGPRFCCETLHWPIIQGRPTQNSPKGWSQASWKARPLSPHLREVLLMDLPWFLVISSSGLAPRSVNMQLLRLWSPFLFLLRYQHILWKRKIRLTSFRYVLNSAPCYVFMLIISSTVSPARSLETMTAPIASFWLMFTGKCLFVFVSASKKSWDSFVWNN